jgi:PAS domain S-box-containing protein
MSINTVQEERFLEVNETFERRRGYARDEIIGHTAVELERWLDAHQQDVLGDTVKEKATSRDQEINLRTKSGQIVVTLQSVESIEWDGRQRLLTCSGGAGEALRRTAAVAG